jgi:hypothetical protein
MRLWAASSRISVAQSRRCRWSAICRADVAVLSKRPVRNEDSNLGKNDLATFATWEANVCNGPKFWLPFVGSYRTFLAAQRLGSAIDPSWIPVKND